MPVRGFRQALLPAVRRMSFPIGNPCHAGLPYLLADVPGRDGQRETAPLSFDQRNAKPAK